MQKLTPFVENDYIELYDYMYDIWIETFGGIISKEHIEFLLHKYFDIGNIRQFLQNGYKYFYICDNGEKTGVLVFAERENEIFIDKLYIRKNFRGKGYSSFAVRQLQKFDKNICLNVNVNNTHAVSVYKHLGFVIDKRVSIPISENMVNEDYCMILKV